MFSLPCCGCRHLCSITACFRMHAASLTQPVLLCSTLDREGQTPLMAAIAGITNSALVVWQNEDLSSEERQAQGAALIANGTRVVKMLLKAGASPNIHWGAERCTPLGYAAQGCPFGPYLDILRMLIDAGADLNAKDTAGRTAYDMAVWGSSNGSTKQLPAVQLLADAARSAAGSSGR